jgi:hypothetical protein
MKQKPLTLDELYKMDGEPVFVVPLFDSEGCNLAYPQWAILATEVGFGPEIMGLSLKGGTSVTWRASKYGETWIAYASRPDDLPPSE